MNVICNLVELQIIKFGKDNVYYLLRSSPDVFSGMSEKYKPFFTEMRIMELYYEENIWDVKCFRDVHQYNSYSFFVV